MPTERREYDPDAEELMAMVNGAEIDMRRRLIALARTQKRNTELPDLLRRQIKDRTELLEEIVSNPQDK